MEIQPTADAKDIFQQARFKFSWRPYQARILESFAAHGADGHFHFVAPPGSGKTVLGIEILRRIGHPNLPMIPCSANSTVASKQREQSNVEKSTYRPHRDLRMRLRNTPPASRKSLPSSSTNTPCSAGISGRSFSPTASTKTPSQTKTWQMMRISGQGWPRYSSISGNFACQTCALP